MPNTTPNRMPPPWEAAFQISSFFVYLIIYVLQLLQRHLEDEAGTAVIVAVEIDLAIEQSGYLTSEGEAETQSLRLLVDLPERLEDMLAVLLGMPSPVSSTRI